MGLFDRFSNRSSGISISDPAINDLLRDSVLIEPTYTGQTVTVEKSLRIVPIFSAVSLLSSAVASLPMRVYKSLPDGGKELAPQHRAARLLTTQPNPLMGADEFFEAIMSGLLMWGNAFALKEKDEAGNLINMWPLAPSRMRISRHPQTGYPEYYIDGRGPFGPDTLIHFRGLSFDGLVGFSPIQQARQTLGIHQALEEHQGRFWSNAARPAGALSHPNRLSPEAAERLRAQFNSRHAGVTNAASTVVLEEGMTWTPLAFPDSDLKLITSLQLSDIRIAQLFRVPPRMLMTDVKDTFTYSSAEWEARDFLKWSLRRWIVRLESALLRDNDLFRSNGLGAAYFPRFDTNELLRGDRSGQAQTDIALLQAGVLSVNEVRGNLDLNPMGDPDIEPPALTVEPDAPVTYPTDPAAPTLPQTK